MKLTHPETDRVLEVDPSHAATFKSQGWVEVKPTPKPKADKK